MHCLMDVNVASVPVETLNAISQQWLLLSAKTRCRSTQASLALVPVTPGTIIHYMSVMR